MTTDNRRAIQLLSRPKMTTLNNAFGTGGANHQDVTASHNQTILNDNFADCAVRINALNTEVDRLNAKMDEVLAALKANCRAVK
jgi:hypothetical protein